ncbi:MAG: sulfate adenylyltransferase subunit CysD [Candidatus Marsarchaeota archaeon]|jgi:sulfate adenylyltransferase subunit 2|nr:sulfate adenylyltransferase subunit CysD [Candidatus Marsarchaeota archaeon]MCL5111829.1 sulfate adenylyltransferase subunit CysD [Candidatus Marsarchaeota archaeon]
MIKQDTKVLEEKSIFILREAKQKFKNVAALWSMGKDSTTMLALARKAFLGEVPFPVIHIDNRIDFPETYTFREYLTKKWKLNLIVAYSDIKPDSIGSACCGQNKPDTLKRVMKQYGFDALIVSIRRDEHGIRSKERYASPRTKNFEWKYKDQPAELWDDYSSKLDEGGHIRIHPLLDWNEIDVWSYIKEEKIPVNPLYFSRNGFRYRSLGCSNCTVPVKSSAKNVTDIIKELETTKIEERSGRSMDKESEYVMSRLRSLGYM